jgi:hypothetical protein
MGMKRIFLTAGCSSETGCPVSCGAELTNGTGSLMGGIGKGLFGCVTN